jgi:hypothetical protein
MTKFRNVGKSFYKKNVNQSTGFRWGINVTVNRVDRMMMMMMMMMMTMMDFKHLTYCSDVDLKDRSKKCASQKTRYQKTRPL